jgi:hypothetical protein
MVHAWQQTHGKPDCSYHDRQWAAKMKEIGLHPSATGEPGGKETGKQMSHYIVSGGPYAQAYQKLQASGFELRWESRSFEKQQKAKRASKTKFTCPGCGQNAWAKPDAKLICGAWARGRRRRQSDCIRSDAGRTGVTGWNSHRVTTRPHYNRLNRRRVGGSSRAVSSLPDMPSPLSAMGALRQPARHFRGCGRGVT